MKKWTAKRRVVEMRKWTAKFLIFTLIVILILSIMGGLTGCASMTGTYHEWRTDIKKTADTTRYETRKKVEDTCRATIVSYESDKLTWEQYKDSESAEQRGWADSAKLRANKAAVTYNEYFLKNSFVFDGNVPADIRTNLPLLED